MKSQEHTVGPRSSKLIRIIAAVAGLGSLLVIVSLVLAKPEDVTPPVSSASPVSEVVSTSDGSDLQQNAPARVIAPVNEAPVLLVRSIEAWEFALFDPIAMAAVSDTGGLFVFGRDGAVEVSAAGGQVRSIGIPDEVPVPQMVTYDAVGHRVLMLETEPLRLAELDVRRESEAEVIDVYDLSDITVRDPVGIAMDSTTGELVILDAEGPSLVRIKTTSNGFDTDNPVTIALDVNDITNASGIAFDESAGLLFVIDPKAGRLYGLDVDGRVSDSWRLTGLELDDMVAMAYTASGDETDEPSTTSLFVAIEADNEDSGRILELSPRPVEESSPFTFTSEVLKTFDVSSFDPPSPDPSGVTYVFPDGPLVLVDSEVDETVTGITHFAGVNLWQLDIRGDVISATNISQVQPTNVAMTNEPTGIAWDPRNGHYFISDDNVMRIFDLDPGVDGEIGTVDDKWSSFSTETSGNDDPEAVAFAARRNAVFVVDGKNREVYRYTAEGEPVGSFDVNQYGVIDPEGIAFNPTTETLFTLGKGEEPIIIETTLNGELLRTIAIDAGPATVPADLAYAPASDGSDTFSFYITFRGIDNNVDPDEMDGVVLEMSAPEPFGHTAPVVDAGPDVSVVLPNEATFRTVVSDDGLPDPPASLRPSWTQIAGPGLVTFSDPTSNLSSAAFTLPGTYTLRLSTFDGELTGSDDVVVTVTGTPDVTSSDVRIDRGFDDAEENVRGAVSLSGADLDMMLDNGIADSALNSAIGLRFSSVPVPQGATIVNAYLSFESDETDRAPTVLIIRGEAVDSSSRFLDDSENLTSRTLTGAAVRWAPEPWFIAAAAENRERSPNLAAVVQEIVNRDGWRAANPLSLIISGSGSRVATAFDTNPETAAVLHIEWQSEG